MLRHVLPRYLNKPTNYLQLLGALQKADKVSTLKHLVQVGGWLAAMGHRDK
jgi:hypothetical protein